MSVRKGQSMFEVIFVIGIIALVLLVVVSLTTRSIANQTYSKNNALATKYAQEGIECLRQQRDYALATNNWDFFRSLATGSNRDLNGSAPNCIGGGSTIPGTDFTRRADFTTSDDQINVIVKVEWEDSQGRHQVRVSTIFTNWNK